MLNVPRLRVLKEVVAQGSFSAAAESLAYTQSAVSQAVATLEAETGVQLVERDRHGVRPTDAGAALVAHADGILARIDAAEADLEALAGGRRGKLRLVSFPSAGATLMPLAIATFRSFHPEVELSLAEGEPDDVAPRLAEGEFDLGLLFAFRGASARSRAGLRETTLLEDPMYVALPAIHPLSGRAQVGLEDLSEESWIQTSAHSPCARHVVRVCHAAGFAPAVSFESDDYGTIQGLVASGAGVALIPRLALTTVRDDIVVLPIAPNPPVRRVIAARPRSAAPTPAVKAMLDVLESVAQRYVEPAAAA